MLGSFKRMKNNIISFDLSASQDKCDDEKGDKKFILAVVIIAVLALVTVVKALYDPVTREQISNLKVSAFDIIMIMATGFGYIYIRKRGKK